MIFKEIKEFLKGYMFTYKTPKFYGGSTIIDVEEDNDSYIIKGSSYNTNIKHSDINSFLGFNNIKNGDESIKLLQGSKCTQVKEEETSENKCTSEDIWQERWWQMFLKFSPFVLDEKYSWSGVVDMTNNGIYIAKKEMDNFFNENKNNNDLLKK